VPSPNLPCALFAASTITFATSAAWDSIDSVGTPPHRWVLRRRIERAEQLLDGSTVPLGEIAARCGFADQSHFTKVFARVARVTPGDWRRRA
jgi:AraC family transcriptional regulator